MEVERKGQSVARARSSESEKKVDKRFGDARARRLGLDFADARARARGDGARRDRAASPRSEARVAKHATRPPAPTPARVSRLGRAAPRPPGPAPRRDAHRFSSRGSGFWRRDSDACRAPGDASRGASRFADRVRDREGGQNLCSCVRTSLMACATTSNPRAPRVERPRAAFMASPRLCASLPKPTDLACVRTGIAATAPLDATGARADATTPTAPSALQEIAAMMVDERTLGVSERRATENAATAFRRGKSHVSPLSGNRKRASRDPSVSCSWVVRRSLWAKKKTKA